MSTPLDRIDEQIGPRVTAALSELAGHHSPAPAGGALRAPSGRRPHWSLAAALAVLLAGIGGLVLITGRELADEGPAPAISDTPTTLSRSPTTLSTTTSTTAPMAPITTVPTAPINQKPRFDAPIPLDQVAVLNPPPLSNTTAFRLLDRLDDFLAGFEAAVSIFVLDESGDPEELVTAIDGPIPPNFFDDRDVVDIGAEYSILIDTEADATSAILISADRTRLLSFGSNADTPSEPQLSESQMLDLAIELAEYLSDRPLDGLNATDRFVPIALDFAGRVAVRYQDLGALEPSVQVVVLSGPEELRTQEVRLVASQFGADEPLGGRRFIGGGDEFGQRSIVEQISPTDVVAIIGPSATTDGALLQWLDSLILVAETDLEVDIEDFNRLTPGEFVLEQGEEDWGRWQLTELPGEGDERCFGFGATVWPAGGGSASGSCTTAGEPVEEVLCLRVGDRAFVGVSIGNLELDFDDARTTTVNTSTGALDDGTPFDVFVIETEDPTGGPIVIDSQTSTSCPG